MRQSQGAFAVIRRPGPSGPEYLVQWNDNWQALHLVGGHRRASESFRDCLCRELGEELGLRAGADARVAELPVTPRPLEYVAFSRSARADTAYTMQLFEVELTPDALAKVTDDPRNAWVGEGEIRDGRATDGRPVSDTLRLLFEKAGLGHGRE